MLKLLATTALATVTISSLVSAAITTADSPDAVPSSAAARTRPVAPAPVETSSDAPIDPLSPTVDLDPTVSVSGASADQLALVDRALADFRSAGLALPDLELIFHDDAAGCRGHDGLFQPQYTPWRLLVCSDLAFVVTHELAHAWEAANLDDEARLAYTEFRGMSTWDDVDAEWKDRAIEDAAFIVQQNLMAGNVRLATPTWTERVVAFEALTGLRSPVRPPAIPGVR